MNKISKTGKLFKNQLIEIRECNNKVAWMLADYLNDNPTLITKDLMAEANKDNVLPEETVYCALLSVFCGLDAENDERSRYLEDNYLRKSIRQLDTKTYSENPYFQNIQIIDGDKLGRWKFKYEKYDPYEAFVYNDIILEPDFREIPQIGFFNETFRFPSIMENDREWMAIKPNEIETMKQPLETIKGDVITFGLGLGYFAYMASLKEEVTTITVVEKDTEVIQLFNQVILPQFQYKEKVRIICTDAFEYIEKQMPAQKFDYAFVDLWHDVSDGLELYLKTKKLEKLNPDTVFLYWIENSLLSGLRWQTFNTVIAILETSDEICCRLSNPFLQKLACSDSY